MSDGVIEFPKRVGLQRPTVQWEQMKSVNRDVLLAAMVTKYGPITFNVDDILAHQGQEVVAQYRRSENLWVLTAAMKPTDKEES